jgi:hypothetical protein
MGWTFFADHNPHQSRADILRREFEHAPSEKNPWAYGFEYITERGSTVYAVMWKENPSEGTPRQYFGIIFMTQRSRGEFGYKEVGEECGPYQYGAPLKMINMLDRLAPSENGYALKWRAAVRAHHAKKRERLKLAPGMRVTIGPSDERVYELVEPRRALFTGRAAGWYVIEVATGARYRMSAAHAARARLAPEPFPGMGDDQLLAELAQ